MSSDTFKTKKIVVVLGMHRSGTSTVMSALESLGVQIGNNFLPPAEDNPKGFFEDKEIHKFNMELLDAINQDWDSLSFISAENLEHLETRGFVERGCSLLQQNLEQNNNFGFKDPRVSKLLVFWKMVFTKLNCDVEYLLCVRHPLSVVKSLAKRNGFEPYKSYLLWLSYNIASISPIENEKLTIIDYDNFIAKPLDHLSYLAENLSLDFDKAKADIFVSEFIDPSLRHSQFDLSDLQNDPDCPSIVLDLFCLLQSATAIESLQDPKNFNSIFELSGSCMFQLSYSFGLIDQLSKEIAGKNSEILASRNQLTELNEQLESPFKANTSSVEVKIYQGVMDENGLNFAEGNAIATTYLIGQGRANINLVAPKVNGALKSIRLDVADTPCFVQLFNIELIADTNEIVWYWNADKNITSLPWNNSAGVQLVSSIDSSGQDGLYIVSLNNDPQLHLNISDKVFNLIKDKRIHFKIDLCISAIAKHSQRAIESLRHIKNEIQSYSKLAEINYANRNDYIVLGASKSDILESIAGVIDSSIKDSNSAFIEAATSIKALAVDVNDKINEFDLRDNLTTIKADMLLEIGNESSNTNQLVEKIKTNITDGLMAVQVEQIATQKLINDIASDVEQKQLDVKNSVKEIEINQVDTLAQVREVKDFIKVQDINIADGFKAIQAEQLAAQQKINNIALAVEQKQSEIGNNLKGIEINQLDALAQIRDVNNFAKVMDVNINDGIKLIQLEQLAAQKLINDIASNIELQQLDIKNNIQSVAKNQAETFARIGEVDCVIRAHNASFINELKVMHDSLMNESAAKSESLNKNIEKWQLALSKQNLAFQDLLAKFVVEQEKVERSKVTIESLQAELANAKIIIANKVEGGQVLLKSGLVRAASRLARINSILLKITEHGDV
ncbi:MAG: hypothetical protein V4732_08935 [Pseudomonadota bacterium]